MIFTVCRSSLPLLLAATVTACTVGPEFRPSPAPAPSDWSHWRSGDATLTGSPGQPGAPAAQWWQAFGDATLDQLQQRALAASPDLHSAALRYTQAHEQRLMVAARRAPELDADAGVVRHRSSEYAANLRILDHLAGDNRQHLGQALGQPYFNVQTGFQIGWEPDLWGRIRRSLEAADADVDTAEALLDGARLSIASALADDYLQLRTLQQLTQLHEQDIQAQQRRLEWAQTRARYGRDSQRVVETEAARLAALRADLPELQQQQVERINRIGLLLGLRPGELPMLSPPRTATTTTLPDYALGLPSQLARRRPDIRAAEARLHRATAAIGIAQADLYPSLRLGAKLGFDAYDDDRFGDWATRAWSIGPLLDLPIFDGGRRRAVVRLREQQQQQAAIVWRQTVLTAWHEVDDALSGYAAEQRALRHWQQQIDSSIRRQIWAEQRWHAGAADFFSVLDAEQTTRQARRELVVNAGRLRQWYVAIHRAIGGGDTRSEQAVADRAR